MQKTKGKTQTAQASAQPDYSRTRQIVWWAVFAAGALFFIPQCLDRFLAPRFFFLSLVLMGGGWLLRRDLRARADWRLHGFDMLLLLWYGWNIASVFWAFSWSEAVFYTQKVLLMLLVYWLVRQSAFIQENQFRSTMRQIAVLLTYTAAALLAFQIWQAFSENGFDNEKLYDYAVGVFGNKSLASDFLFFLLVYNVLFFREFKRIYFPLASAALLLALILLLQTRTVYLAVVLGVLVYCACRAATEPAFRTFLFRRMLPPGLLFAAALAAVLAAKGRGNSLAERLNPATYLESISANERRFVWYKTDLLNRQYPWTGVGNGSWKFLFPSNNIQGGYRLQEQNVVFTRVHNDYLEIRAETGLIGVALFIALFGAAFIAGLAALRKAETPEARHDLSVLSAALVGYCVIQYFDFPRERIELQAILGFLFGLTAHRSRAWWMRGPSVGIPNQVSWLGAAAAAGLAFNLLIGWYRIDGEIHNVNMLKAQARGDYRSMANEAEAAQNAFYEYDDVVLPLPYHAGLAWFHLEQTPEAVAAFEQAYRMNPWSFPVINNYGSALAQDNRFREAVPLFEKTVEINPKFDEGKLNLAYLWMRLGDSARAMQWYGRVDTILNPQTEPDRRKNAAVKTQQDEFMKMWKEYFK